MPPESIGTAQAATSVAVCPFCGGEGQQRVLSTLDQARDLCEYARCGDCGTLFLHPAPDEARLASAYADGYYGEGEAKFDARIERLRDLFATGRARRLAGGLPEKAAILDVGCGDGRLLRAFSRIGNYRLHGIELPGKAADRASTVPGVSLHRGTLDDAELPAAGFDLVTLVHVLEHLPRPGDAVARLARLLKPGGRLFIAYPNISSWQAAWFGGDWFHLDPPRHLTLVPPSSLSRALTNHGVHLHSETHFNAEQNLYGWLQSALNRLPTKRNLAYEALKRNRAYLEGASIPGLAAQLLVLGLGAPAALAIDLLSVACGRGATVDLLFQRPTTAAT